jgi:LysM domain-containing protein
LVTRLERNVFAVLVIMALCAALMVASPAPAQAQADSAAGDNQTAHAYTPGHLSHAVVRPGDSLWTISEERLGPDATPQRIANGVEQIYELNRERIGADPALIIVGQELLVPQAMSERPTGAPAAHGSSEAGPRDRVAEGTTAKGKKPAARKVAHGAALGGGTPETLVRRSDGTVSLPVLPDEAPAAPIAAVMVSASNEALPTSAAPVLRIVGAGFASAASALDEISFGGSADTPEESRRSVGLVIIALTLVVAVLMAWKLPMRRTTLGDASRWGIAASYYGEVPTADRITPFVFHSGSLGGYDGNRDERTTRPGAPGSLGGERRGSPMASPGRKGSTPSVRRRARKARAVARNSLALGAHNPKVRSVPLRVHASRRARKPRLRRGASRQSMPPSHLRTNGGR